MTGKAQFIPALINPTAYFSFYREKKEKEGFRQRFLALVLVSGLLYATSFFAAFPSFLSLSFIERAKLSGTEEEVLRVIVTLLGGMWGLLLPFFFIGAGAFFLYLFFRDIDYRSLLFIMSVLYLLFLAGLAFELPLQFMTGAEEVIQPLGLGSAGVLVFKHGFWQELFNFINVFTVWGALVMYSALRILSFKSKQYVRFTVFGITLFLIFLFSLFAALASGQLV
jgi:hypothetical protein